MIKGAL